MKTLIASLALLMAAGTVAQACPDYQLGGDVDYGFTGDVLLREREYSVQVGGSYALNACGHTYSGYVPAAPTMSFRLLRMDHYPLDIHVEAPCDAVLLVRAANGYWHYDDDSYGGHNPEVSLRGSAPLNGRIDIWVGSYGSTTCYGTLHLQTDD